MRKDFVDRICEEIDRYTATRYTQEPVKTIYLGGGTPSLLEVTELERIFSHLEKIFRLEPEEITMEINPDDVTVDYLKGLLSIGIDRASMGIQSFDAGRLTFMNRAHTPDQARFSLEALSRAGFRIFTTDLIYGSPGQTTQELEADIDQLLEFDPPHISAYALTIEPRTRLGKQVELGRLEPADDELVSEHFDLLNEKLSANGIYRYEVSNYCKAGFEALHNGSYWRHENYLGFGPSSHSFWWDDKENATRWKTENNINLYLSEPFEKVYMEKEGLAMEALGEERLFLGLRTCAGVSLAELHNRYHYHLSAGQREWISQKQDEGLLQFDEQTIALTDEGIKIADHLIVELLTRH
jgi:oxygen-independent coproporphyrinogen III oxidase